MPGKVKVKILAGRNLPVMDRAGDTTDAFVEIKFGGVTHKTDICKKSLNPHWNSAEWYRFEVDESELQDEPLQLRLLDHDTYSANDTIGKIVISLSPLISRDPSCHSKFSSTGTVMSGWVPVFDTMHGMRGELNIIVKVELFSDYNKYKTSSCGVQFFHCSIIPPGYKVITIHGFVEELVVNDDPEYQWIDKIRTPRASNEARQAAFIKLSNQAQRLVGVKAADLGANAVLAYHQAFDMEGEAGVVARATGTAVTIEKIPVTLQPVHMPVCNQQDKAKENNSPRRHRHESGPSGSTSNHAHTAPIGILRRSSDSDVSVTPKGSHPSGGSILKSSMHPNNIDMLEYPFLTLTEYPVGFVLHIAGSVFARSVKLIDGAADVATRTAWWTELRTELRSHARALKCNSVITYSEDASICEDVCILSVSGTAAIINLECDFSAEPNLNEDSTSCSITHLNSNSPQYSRTLCGICGVRPVSSVLLATCAIPPHVATAAVANTISAAATRARRTSPQGEAGARDLSDQLPFLEYELHKLLLAKLRMQGANSIFNLETQITIGERYVSALATGTAVRLLALPGPSPPIVKAPEGDKVAAELQKALLDNFTINKVASGYDVATTETKVNGVIQEHEKVEIAPLDLCSDKDACVLEIDETEDVETAKALCIRRRPLPVLTVHPDVKFKPNANPQAFVQVWRGKYVGGTPMAEKHVSRVLDGVYYKLRTMKPCCITPVRFQLDYVDEDIQLLISGAAIPLIDPYGGPENGTRVKKISSISQSITKNMSRINRHQIKRRADDDIIFNFDYDKLLPPLPEKKRQSSELKERTPKVRQAQIALTPLPFIHGAAKQTWICALRLLFVRETTSVKELGGLNGFLHSTMSEVLAIVRAYTAALGGNTLASFYITQLMIQDNAHKNQGQCLLSVGGDVMHVTY